MPVPSFQRCLPVIAALLISPVAQASVDICSRPGEGAAVSISYYENNESSFENRPGQTRHESSDVDWHYDADNSWGFSAGHRYKHLNLEQVPIQTNGHLHSVFFAGHWTSSNDSWRISVAPALSGSSNAFKRLDLFLSDTIQVLGAAVFTNDVSDAVNLRIGVCGDHRFGDFEVYPVASVDWEFHPDWLLELGFPETRLDYRISKRFDSSIRVVPDGNEWYVSNKEYTRQSRFIYESWLAEWSLDWHATEKLTVTASAGMQFDNRYEVGLQDGSMERLDAEDAARFGIALAWRF